MIHCMESLHKNKHALQALAISEEAKKALDGGARKLLFSEVFWDKTDGFLKLLKPLCR